MDGPARRSPRTDAVRDSVDLLFRRRAGQLSATLSRILGFEHLDLVEDVVHDAFVRALRHWPYTGIPDNPSAWILSVARNRALDVLRRQGRWRELGGELERAILPHGRGGQPASYFSHEVEDDQLRLMFACCHPALSRDGQVALTLKTVGGFSVDEIGRAFFARRATIAQRIVRAKRTLREVGATLEVPSGDGLVARRGAVLEVLYLLFNEGYAAFEGEDLVRTELCGEAIRLAELVGAHAVLGGPEAHALAALMLFQAARQPARVDAHGELVPLARQDRGRWDRRALRRALEHLGRAGRGAEVTSYHLQAEIASCHSLAESFERTDWPRILDCYDALAAQDPSPVVALNRAVALAEVGGAEAALRSLAGIGDHPTLRTYEGRWAIEADLLARLGRRREAAGAFAEAMRHSRSEPVRRHLARRRRELEANAEAGRIATRAGAC